VANGLVADKRLATTYAYDPDTLQFAKSDVSDGTSLGGWREIPNLFSGMYQCLWQMFVEDEPPGSSGRKSEIDADTSLKIGGVEIRVLNKLQG